MSERGFFAVDRGIWEHPLFADEPFSEREAWVWLISTAAWAPTRIRAGKGVFDLARGQLAFATRFLAVKWKWPHSSVVRYLKRLETETMVTTQATRDATLITICNYNEYQSPRNAEETQSGTQPETLAVRERYKEEETNNITTKKQKQVRARARSALAEDWRLDERDIAHARDRGFSPDQIAAMERSFANHHRSRGSLMADWHAAWRTWCENEIKFRGGQNGQRPGSDRTYPAAQQSGSAAVFAGVAAAAERRARERESAGQQRPADTALDAPRRHDADFFRAG